VVSKGIPILDDTILRLTIAFRGGQVYVIARTLKSEFPQQGAGLCAHLGGTMLGSLPFIVCVILQYHYHDPIPWYIWVPAVIALCVSFGEPAMRAAVKVR
jgi:hypothetical protein